MSRRKLGGGIFAGMDDRNVFVAGMDDRNTFVAGHQGPGIFGDAGGHISGQGIFGGADDRNKFGQGRVDESALPDYPRGLAPGQVFYDNADTGRPSLNIPVKLGGTDDGYFYSRIGADDTVPDASAAAAAVETPTTNLVPAVVLPEPVKKASLLMPLLLAAGSWYLWKKMKRGK